MKASYEAGVHRKLTSTARRIARAFRLDRITELDLSSAIALAEDLIEIFMFNELNRPWFKEAGRKVLFLPHCSRKYINSRCKAKFREEILLRVLEVLLGLPGKGATELAENRGYDAYILPGGSRIPKTMEKFRYDAIVGVACGMEIMQASRMIKDIPAQRIPS